MKVHLELNGYSFRSGVWMCTSTWNHNAYKLPACIFKQCLSSLCTNFSFNIYFFSSSRPFLSPFSLFPTSFHTYLFFFLSTLMHFSVFFLSTTSSWEMRYFSTGMYTKSCRSNTTVRVHTLKITLQRVLTQTFFLPWNWLLFVEHCQHTQHCVI